MKLLLLALLRSRAGQCPSLDPKTEQFMKRSCKLTQIQFCAPAFTQQPRNRALHSRVRVYMLCLRALPVSWSAHGASISALHARMRHCNGVLTAPLRNCSRKAAQRNTVRTALRCCMRETYEPSGELYTITTVPGRRGRPHPCLSVTNTTPTLHHPTSTSPAPHQHIASAPPAPHLSC